MNKTKFNSDDLSKNNKKANISGVDTKQSISKRTPDASLPRCGFKFGGMFVFHQASITSLSNQDSC